MSLMSGKKAKDDKYSSIYSLERALANVDMPKLDVIQEVRRRQLTE